MRGVTDALIQGACTAAHGDDQTYAAVVADLRVRHTLAVAELLEGAEARTALLKTVDAYLDEFATFCRSILVLGEVTPRAMDAVSSLGERINARIVAAHLREMGLSAEAVDATELIITDDRFQQAAPLMEETRARVATTLAPLLDEGVVPIVTGFIGATSAGVTTTLGRGGSDYSAAILGAALDAAEVWTWTDVDGVMSADPRIVEEARVIPSLSYGEVGELAYFGAKVLHPKTISPVIERSIPVWVKNTFNPEFPGTRIIPEPESAAGTVKAVTAIQGLSMVTVEGHRPHLGAGRHRHRDRRRHGDARHARRGGASLRRAGALADQRRGHRARLLRVQRLARHRRRGCDAGRARDSSRVYQRG